MQKNAKISMIGIAMILIEVMAFVSLIQSPFTLIKLAYADDVYDDYIVWVALYQWNATSSAYDLLANSSTDYTVRVLKNQAIKFDVKIKFNSTFADDEADAVAYTSVYQNITYDSSFVWMNEELNNTAVSLADNFYYLTETGIWNNTASYPAEGVTYSSAIKYFGYY